ncbi:hypothetical protein C5167_023613 [Papaver somniferum]|uniref:U-box domain-containing protein n=1 Tax=Papaver somniferum TaxID=3469 RepID=A0A4Y7JL93_PAPSO|nr:hypothetical protein C5167_023613 [Papaver somniferum]
MVKVPECLRCPLSRGIFRDPYATSDCNTYEKFVVFEHFGHCVVNGCYTDPDTEKDITFIRRNYALRDAVEWFKEQNCYIDFENEVSVESKAWSGWQLKPDKKD